MTDIDFVKSGIFEIFDTAFPRQRRWLKMFGEKLRCLICGSFEHLRKFCPMINIEFTKCKKRTYNRNVFHKYSMFWGKK